MSALATRNHLSIASYLLLLLSSLLKSLHISFARRFRFGNGDKLAVKVFRRSSVCRKLQCLFICHLSCSHACAMLTMVFWQSHYEMPHRQSRFCWCNGCGILICGSRCHRRRPLADDDALTLDRLVLRWVSFEMHLLPLERQRFLEMLLLG